MNNLEVRYSKILREAAARLAEELGEQQPISLNPRGYKPKRQQARAKPRDKLDVKTAEIILDPTHERRIRWRCDLQRELLWNPFVDYCLAMSEKLASYRKAKTGRMLDGNNLSKLIPNWRRLTPDLCAVPYESAVCVAHTVAQVFDRYAKGTCTLQTLREDRRKCTLYFRRGVKIRDASLRLPGIGRVEFALDLQSTKKSWKQLALVGALRGAGPVAGEGKWVEPLRIRGVTLYEKTTDAEQSRWFVKISFERLGQVRPVAHPENYFETILKIVAFHKGDKISSAELSSKLAAKGIVLHSRGLADVLREFGIPQPRNIWLDGKCVKGWRVADIQAAAEVADTLADGC